MSEKSGGQYRPRVVRGFGWSQHVADGAVVVCLAGELDLSAAAELRRLLMAVAASDTAATIALDLSDVSFIDAQCTGLIVSAWSAAKVCDRELYVDGLHGVPARVFGVLGLEALMRRRQPDGRGGDVDGRFRCARGTTGRWHLVGAAHKAR